MAVLGNSVPTLVDVAKRLDPDGKIARIAEYLNATNGVLNDMVWKEGNLPTGERTTVRAGLPGVAFRALNEGTPRSKSNVSQVDEGAAQLAGNFEVDRMEAVLSGDIAGYRLSEAAAFYESMNQTMASCLFYGNAGVSAKQFTGLAPRFNTLTGQFGSQVIDGGGTGSDNFSMYVIGWGEQTVRGIYPKGSKGGLRHEDMSENGMGSDGFPKGKMLYDAAGNGYVGYQDYFEWNCGLSVKDPRYVVRGANISRSALRADMTTGTDLQDLLLQMVERIQSTDGVRAAIYVPRVAGTMFKRQLLKAKNPFLGYDDIGGRKVMHFDGVPIVRTDALNVNEARVV